MLNRLPCLHLQTLDNVRQANNFCCTAFCICASPNLCHELPMNIHTGLNFRPRNVSVNTKYSGLT
jgi:hypothetical protein